MRRQDLNMLALYYLGFSRIRNLILRSKGKTVTRFVTFHNISPEAYPLFRNNIFFLKRFTNVVSLEEYFAGRPTSKKINVVITFDDGYQSWLSFALPVLKELGLPAIFFVTSGFIGLTKDQETKFIQENLLLKQGFRLMTRGLNIEDVRTIVKEGFSVGGHTLNHSNLGTANSRVRLKYEIAEDKIRLENMTGTNVEYFAYPSGVYYNSNVNLAELLKEIGYKGAVTTEPGFNEAQSNPFLLHRDLTRAEMSGKVFRARVFGDYDGVRFIKDKFARLLHEK